MVSKEGERDAGKGKARLQEAWMLTRGHSASRCLEGPSLQNSPAVGCGQFKLHFSGPPLRGSPQLSSQRLFPS